MPKHYNNLLFHVKKKRKKEESFFYKFEIWNEIMYFLLNFMKYKINMPKYVNRDIKNCLIFFFSETKHEDNVRHKLKGSFCTDI